jgi:hypothetical protein
MAVNNEKKKEILKFAKTLVIVLGCWLVFLYGKFNSFARETINRSYEEKVDSITTIAPILPAKSEKRSFPSKIKF